MNIDENERHDSEYNEAEIADKIEADSVGRRERNIKEDVEESGAQNEDENENKEACEKLTVFADPGKFGSGGAKVSVTREHELKADVQYR